MNTKVELLPCPFCGGEGKLREVAGEMPLMHPVVRCKDCWCQTCAQRTEEAAVVAWNTRPQVPQGIGRDELVEALGPFADAAEVNDEAGRDDPDDNRIWIVQAYGCQLAEITDADLERCRTILSRMESGEKG